MSPAFVHVITFLLGLAGFGLSPNPKAPSADQALAYAVPDADVVVHVDLASILPGNYKVLTGLTTSAAVKASPELAAGLRQAIGQVEGFRGLARTATGLDVVNDLSDATGFVRVSAQGAPAFLLSVHGKFGGALLDKVARMAGGAPARVGGGSFLQPSPEAALGLTRDGVLLAGTAALVRERLADAWVAPPHGAGTPLARVAELLEARPVFGVALALGKDARAQALQMIGERNFAGDVVKRHKFLGLGVFRDGVGWTFDDSSAAGLDAMTTFSEGALELMRAAVLAPRGVAKLALGGLASYRGLRPEIDELLKRKAELLALVDAFTGDGAFKATVTRDPKLLRLTVRATGKTLSEVLPVGALVGLAAIGAATFATRVGGGDDDAPPVPPAVEPRNEAGKPGKPAQPGKPGQPAKTGVRKPL